MSLRGVYLRCAQLLAVTLALSVLENNRVECKVSCLDNTGNPVDWFIVIKLPQISSSSYETVRNGYAQLYMDVNNQQWTLLEQGIDATSSNAVYYTLQQIYSSQGSQSIAYMMYNDETPAGYTTYTYGHTKGDVCFDNSTGFWLVHSVPAFPPVASDGYSYPDSGREYGQSFLCVTYGYSMLNEIGTQFLYNYPQFYDYSVPEYFTSNNIDLAEALDGKYVETAPWNHYADLTSQAGQLFTSFAKFTNFDQDLYDGWLAPYYQAEFDAETWQNGPGNLPSNCSAGYEVQNVEAVSILGISYNNTDDHSKWAVSTNKDWICIGDINREESQETRAGGTVCSHLPQVAAAFFTAVSSAALCPV